ncbi:MAG: phosphotransferase, partial [Nanoarchaeota archaeon]
NYFKGKIPVPKIIVYDNTKKKFSKVFVIYHKIKGDNLYAKWHLLSNAERKNIVKQLCKILKKINNSSYGNFVKKFKLKSSINWHDKILSQIRSHLKNIESKKILSTEFIQKIKSFVETHHQVLNEQKIALVHWDVHFDNILIKNNQIVGLIDFERTELASIDFTLDVIKRMVEYPKKYMSKKFEKFAKKKEYSKLLNWFKEFYPELFQFKNLDKRLDLYSIEHDLATLLGWPNSKATKKMIAKTVRYKSTI